MNTNASGKHNTEAWYVFCDQQLNLKNAGPHQRQLLQDPTGRSKHKDLTGRSKHKEPQAG